MDKFIAAVQTLADQKLHFEQKCKSLEEMETKLRAYIVELKIEISVLKEKVRRLEAGKAYLKEASGT
jgi:hypothetical protein